MGILINDSENRIYNSHLAGDYLYEPLSIYDLTSSVILRRNIFSLLTTEGKNILNFIEWSKDDLENEYQRITKELHKEINESDENLKQNLNFNFNAFTKAIFHQKNEMDFKNYPSELEFRSMTCAQFVKNTNDIVYSRLNYLIYTKALVKAKIEIENKKDISSQTLTSLYELPNLFESIYNSPWSRVSPGQLLINTINKSSDKWEQIFPSQEFELTIKTLKMEDLNISNYSNENASTKILSRL